MKLTPELAFRAISPTTAFWNHQSYSGESLKRDQHDILWNDSTLNPKNKIDSLAPIQNPSWRIDGCTSCGTQFFTIPTFISPLPPLRVDTFLPNPSQWPEQLREDLKIDKSFLYRDCRVLNFGVAQHVLRSFEAWSTSFSNFQTLYEELQFGSRIIFENMSRDVREIRIRIVRAHDLERQLLPLGALQTWWAPKSASLPEAININRLDLIRQFQDSASLVQVSNSDGNRELMVFKTMSDSPKYLYHELGVLLSMPEHPNIIGRPLHIVTKKCRFGGKTAVVGFTVPYHRRGTLRDILPLRRIHGTLKLESQLKWAIQIVEVLRHIRMEGPGFYCDLRLDNIVLSETDDVVLIDFEQRGVLPAFASRLDNYLKYVITLANDVAVVDPAKEKYKELYDKYIKPFAPTKRGEHHGCIPWLCMSQAEKEASEMYMLGRLLWCIFEGVSAPQREIWMEYLHEPDVEFPDFVRTPEEVRGLILICTSGWNRGCNKLRRKDFELEIETTGDQNGGNMSGINVLDGMVEMWREELNSAKEFLDQRSGGDKGRSCERGDYGGLSLEGVLEILKKMFRTKFCHYCRRPSGD